MPTLLLLASAAEALEPGVAVGRWSPEAGLVSYAWLEGAVPETSVDRVCLYGLLLEWHLAPTLFGPTSREVLPKDVSPSLTAFREGLAAGEPRWRWDLPGAVDAEPSAFVTPVTVSQGGSVGDLGGPPWDRWQSLDRPDGCGGLVEAVVIAYDRGQVDVRAGLHLPGGVVRVEASAHLEFEDVDELAPVARRLGQAIGRHLSEAHRAARGMQSTDQPRPLAPDPVQPVPLPAVQPLTGPPWSVLPTLLDVAPRPLLAIDWQGEWLTAANRSELRVWAPDGREVVTHPVHAPRAVAAGGSVVAVCDELGARVWPRAGGAEQRLGPCDDLVATRDQVVVAEGRTLRAFSDAPRPAMGPEPGGGRTGLEPQWAVELPLPIRWLAPNDPLVMVGSDRGVAFLDLQSGAVVGGLDRALPEDAVMPLGAGSYATFERAGRSRVLDGRLARRGLPFVWDLGPRFVVPSGWSDPVGLGEVWIVPRGEALYPWGMAFYGVP